MTVIGEGATVVITEGLSLGGGGGIFVSNISIGGDVTLTSGSASLGSPGEPGSIYVNGDLTLQGGQRHIWGDVYVNGNFTLCNANIHGNVYVDGDLILKWGAPSIDDGVCIHYTGTFTHPSTMSPTILSKCIHNTTEPGFTMPDLTVPPAKSPDWYEVRGYVSSGPLINNKKIFSQGPISTSGSASNVIIIASDGDISITGGGNKVTGIFFAPNGKVTFSGDSFEGVVIARDGFFVTSGGTTVTFKNINNYINNPEDYPF